MLFVPARRVPRILGPLARDERMIAIGREGPLFRSRAAAMERALRPLRVNKRTLCLAADLVTLQGKLAISCAPRSSVPGMCRAQIGCAMNVPWCGWGECWQALQVIDY